MIYKPNIQTESRIKEDLISRHLRYLYEKKTMESLKILAVEFLSQYIDEDGIYDKLEHFYQKETNRYIKNLLKKALNREIKFTLNTELNIDDYLSREQKSVADSSVNPSTLSNTDLALLRYSRN